MRGKSSPIHLGSACLFIETWGEHENQRRGPAPYHNADGEGTIERQIEPDLFTGRRNTSAAGRRDDDILPDKEKEEERRRILVCVLSYFCGKDQKVSGANLLLP